MLDEAVSNLTCALEAFNMSRRALLVLAADNGGASAVAGNNYPLAGCKGSVSRGGISATALLHGRLLPSEIRGKVYNGLMHVTGEQMKAS
jgi:hypothetical protein